MCVHVVSSFSSIGEDRLHVSGSLTLSLTCTHTHALTHTHTHRVGTLITEEFPKLSDPSGLLKVLKVCYLLYACMLLHSCSMYAYSNETAFPCLFVPRVIGYRGSSLNH